MPRLCERWQTPQLIIQDEMNPNSILMKLNDICLGCPSLFHCEAEFFFQVQQNTTAPTKCIVFCNTRGYCNAIVQG